MIEEIDIWRAAEQMRELYGANAAIHSAMRADKLVDQGDAEGFDMWKRKPQCHQLSAVRAHETGMGF